MSLSRYFKNTSSFQAEDLVKHASKTTAGWTADPQKDQQPFQSQKGVPPATGGNTITGKESTIPRLNSLERRAASNDIPPAPPPQELAEDGTLPASSDASVDLSNYLDRTEAERQIAEAYHQGVEVGREKFEEEFGASARALLLICQQLDTLRATIINNSSKELLEFTLAIAERILRLSVREQDHTIVATIEEALRRAVKSDEFTIHIHPDDYDTLVAKSAEIVAGLSGLNNIVIRKDQSVERGGASIESDNCTLDATIASQFEMIREEVKNKST